MIKKIFLMLVCCIVGITDASAYEYKKLDTLFRTINTDYVRKANFKNISIKGLKLLSQFDTNLKLYNSDSKAFLYQNNVLIGIFDLPKKEENSESWKNFMMTILRVSAQRSEKISEYEKDIESSLFNLIADNLDSFSRIENTKYAEKALQYSIHKDILYIRPNLFKDGTADFIKRITANHPNIKGIILDLKGNIGGSLNEAIQTADLFLDGGIITYSEDKFKQVKYYTATEGDIFNGKPIVVLTDDKTASAAEIIVAAFGEQSRAVIVGTKTFGKGSIQNTYQIEKKTLFLTSGYFFSPSGKSINNIGLIPQICTGYKNSCVITDKSNPNKELLVAIDLINNNLG